MASSQQLKRGLGGWADSFGIAMVLLTYIWLWKYILLCKVHLEQFETYDIAMVYLNFAKLQATQTELKLTKPTRPHEARKWNPLGWPSRLPRENHTLGSSMFDSLEGAKAYFHLLETIYLLIFRAVGFQGNLSLWHVFCLPGGGATQLESMVSLHLPTWFS